jgi:hypothetical protein
VYDDFCVCGQDEAAAGHGAEIKDDPFAPHHRRRDLQFQVRACAATEATHEIGVDVARRVPRWGATTKNSAPTSLDLPTSHIHSLLSLPRPSPIPFVLQATFYKRLAATIGIIFLKTIDITAGFS